MECAWRAGGSPRDGHSGREQPLAGPEAPGAAGRGTAGQVASLPQLLQPCPQRAPHPGVQRCRCPTRSPEQQHQLLQLPGHADAGAAAAGDARGAGGTIRTLPRGRPRPGGPGSRRGCSAPPWAPGLGPGALSQLPSPGLPPPRCPGASGPPDSHGGQQQGKCREQEATVAHGCGASHRVCTGSGGAGPAYIGMAR